MMDDRMTTSTEEVRSTGVGRPLDGALIVCCLCQTRLEPCRRRLAPLAVLPLGG